MAGIRIEFVYVAPAGPIVREYLIEAPVTVEAVLQRAAQDADLAGAGLAGALVGVFGRIVGRQELLAEGDRVEVYRGPAVDPKQARRARAARPRGQ